MGDWSWRPRLEDGVVCSIVAGLCVSSTAPLAPFHVRGERREPPRNPVFYCDRERLREKVEGIFSDMKGSPEHCECNTASDSSATKALIDWWGSKHESGVQFRNYSSFLFSRKPVQHVSGSCEANANAKLLHASSSELRAFPACSGSKISNI